MEEASSEVKRNPKTRRQRNRTPKNRNNSNPNDSLNTEKDVQKNAKPEKNPKKKNWSAPRANNENKSNSNRKRRRRTNNNNNTENKKIEKTSVVQTPKSALVAKTPADQEKNTNYRNKKKNIETQNKKINSSLKKNENKKSTQSLGKKEQKTERKNNKKIDSNKKNEKKPENKNNRSKNSGGNRRNRNRYRDRRQTTPKDLQTKQHDDSKKLVENGTTTTNNNNNNIKRKEQNSQKHDRGQRSDHRENRNIHQDGRNSRGGRTSSGRGRGRGEYGRRGPGRGGRQKQNQQNLQKNKAKNNNNNENHNKKLSNLVEVPPKKEVINTNNNNNNHLAKKKQKEQEKNSTKVVAKNDAEKNKKKEVVAVVNVKVVKEEKNVAPVSVNGPRKGKHPSFQKKTTKAMPSKPPIKRRMPFSQPPKSGSSSSSSIYSKPPPKTEKTVPPTSSSNIAHGAAERGRRKAPLANMPAPPPAKHIRQIKLLKSGPITIYNVEPVKKQKVRKEELDYCSQVVDHIYALKKTLKKHNKDEVFLKFLEQRLLTYSQKDLVEQEIGFLVKEHHHRKKINFHEKMERKPPMPMPPIPAVAAVNQTQNEIISQQPQQLPLQLLEMQPTQQTHSHEPSLPPNVMLDNDRMLPPGMQQQEQQQLSPTTMMDHREKPLKPILTMILETRQFGKVPLHIYDGDDVGEVTQSFCRKYAMTDYFDAIYVNVVKRLQSVETSQAFANHNYHRMGGKLFEQTTGKRE